MTAPFTGVAFTVTGTPAPQGSKRAIVRGNRAVLVESSAKVRPWRDAVRHEAADAMNGAQPFDGPLEVHITFRLPKGVSVKRDLPTTAPDLDKLVRSTFDGLTDGGVWRDDSLAVRIVASKVYGVTPGADITVRQIPPMSNVVAFIQNGDTAA